jgi:spore coat protein X
MSFFENSCDVRGGTQDRNRCNPCCGNNGFNALAGVGTRGFDDGLLTGDIDQVALAKQVSEDFISVKDSCEVFIESRSDQSSVIIQVAINLLISLITVVISDDEDQDALQADIEQIFASKQVTRQKICIENSRNVKIEADNEQDILAIQLAVNVIVSLVTILITL